MPEALALSAALVFGLVHFVSGLLARRADSFAVALFGQLGGVVLVSGTALVMPATEVTAVSLTWGGGIRTRDRNRCGLPLPWPGHRQHERGRASQ